jgi:O-antigen/teichoic acid export membrane protein
MLTAIRSKLQALTNHQGFRRYAANTSWMMGEKILRMFVGLFVGIWVARYLGPEQFGLLSYAQSFVFLFTAIATLGLDGIVVRELVKDQSRRDELLGTAFGLKFIGALLILPVLWLAVQATSNNSYTNLLVFIIASATIFQSFNVIDFYYQAKVKSKYVALANSVALASSSIVKIALILTEAPLVAFAALVAVDTIFLSIGLIFSYKKISNLKMTKWSFSGRLAQFLLSESWLMMVAGLAILIYMKIDQVMIKEMINPEAVGQYAAAARISEAWYFIPMALASSLFPAIVNARKISEKLFLDRLQNLFSFMVLLAVSVAIPLTFLSDWIIEILYGSAYRSASSVLAVHIWAGVFVFLSVANDKWFYATYKPGLLAVKVSVGALTNIILNYFFISRYGIVGSAVATLISYSVSVIWSDLIFRSLWPLFVMKIKALSLISIVNLLTVNRRK